MLDKPVLRDSTLERILHDFDALADQLHTLIERDPPRVPDQAALCNDTFAFTTEWQMVSAAREGLAD